MTQESKAPVVLNDFENVATLIEPTRFLVRKLDKKINLDALKRTNRMLYGKGISEDDRIYVGHGPDHVNPSWEPASVCVWVREMKPGTEPGHRMYGVVDTVMTIEDYNERYREIA